MALRSRGVAAILALVVLTSAATAQTVDIPAELAACLKVFGAVERLACYDRLARYNAPPSPRAYVPAPAPVPPAVLPNAYGGGPAAAQTIPQQFGSERLPQRGAPAVRPLDRVSAGITDFSMGPSGRFTVTLDNGQVWRQVEGDTSVARFNKRTTRRVSITRGALGSYDLTFGGGNASFKVVRLQ